MIKVDWRKKSIDDLLLIDDKVLLTNKLTDNAISRVAFATEKKWNGFSWLKIVTYRPE